LPSTPLTPRRGPKATKISLEHILDSAQTVFAREGVQGSSIRAIAREATCDPALIYYHFPNKEGLLEALLDRTIVPVAAEISALGDPQDTRGVAERLWQVTRIYHAHLGGSSGMRGLVRGEIVRGGEGIQESIGKRIQPMFEAISRLIGLGIQRGDIRPDASPLFATFFLARMELEILDLVPIMAPRIAGVPADIAVPLAEATWFRLFWRGIATRPDEALPFLPNIPDPFQGIAPPQVPR